MRGIDEQEEYYASEKCTAQILWHLENAKSSAKAQNRGVVITRISLAAEFCSEQQPHYNYNTERSIRLVSNKKFYAMPQFDFISHRFWNVSLHARNWRAGRVLRIRKMHRPNFVASRKCKMLGKSAEQSRCHHKNFTCCWIRFRAAKTE